MYWVFRPTGGVSLQANGHLYAIVYVYQLTSSITHNQLSDLSPLRHTVVNISLPQKLLLFGQIFDLVFSHLENLSTFQNVNGNSTIIIMKTN